MVGKKKQYSTLLQCFWAIHLDLETRVEEIFIGTSTLKALRLKLPYCERQVTHHISAKNEMKRPVYCILKILCILWQGNILSRLFFLLYSVYLEIHRNIQFRWRLETTNLCLWLVNTLIAEIWYLIKKRNENDKTINLIMKNNNKNAKKIWKH